MADDDYQMDVLVPKSMVRAIQDVIDEREKQGAKGASIDFDDKNTEQDWIAFLLYYISVGATKRLWKDPGRPFRQAMVIVAALAVAAIEWCDRRSA